MNQSAMIMPKSTMDEMKKTSTFFKYCFIPCHEKTASTMAAALTTLPPAHAMPMR